MSKPVETKVVATLDELLYGDIPKTALYSDLQELEEAKSIFKQAEIGKEFSSTVYWLEWLKPILVENYLMAAQSEQSYMGIDRDKKDNLAHKRQLAKYALDFVAGQIEDAQTTPRPIRNI